MTSRNRKLITGVSFIAVLPVLVIAIWPWLFPLHREPPEVVGQELGPTGQPLRRIVFEKSYRVIGWLPDPEGGHQTRTSYIHYFLESPGIRRELAFLPQVLSDSFIEDELCRPVRNSPLWISAGYFRPGSEIDVVIFDADGIRTKRTIVISPDDRDPGKDFWFENGNTMLRFRLGSGIGSYDVLADTIVSESTR